MNFYSPLSARWTTQRHEMDNAHAMEVRAQRSEDFVFVAELPAIYAFPLLAVLLMMVVGPFGKYTPI
jgi:hypothetical protein